MPAAAPDDTADAALTADDAGPARPRLLTVTTTLATREQALALAQALVDQRLAACAQIEPIDSVYRWQGAVEQAAEQRLVLKTTAQRWPALAAAIRAAHPYALPAIHAVAVAQADPAYAAWVADAVSPPAAGPDAAG